MKKKINLLVSREDRSVLYKKIQYFRILIITFSLLSVLIFLFLLIFFFIQTNSYKEFTIKKEKLLTELNQKISLEKRIETLLIYANEIENLKQSDINFLPYYKILTESLNESTESAQLSSVSVDNKRNVIMKLNFSSYKSMLAFTNALQSDAFLNKFSSLNLESFSLSEKNTVNYSLIIKGNFNPIQTNIND